MCSNWYGMKSWAQNLHPLCLKLYIPCQHLHRISTHMAYGERRKRDVLTNVLDVTKAKTAHRNWTNTTGWNTNHWCAAYVINFLTYQGLSKNTCTDTWINPSSVTSAAKAFTSSLSSVTIRWYIGQSIPISAWHRTVAIVSWGSQTCQSTYKCMTKILGSVQNVTGWPPARSTCRHTWLDMKRIYDINVISVTKSVNSMNS